MNTDIISVPGLGDLSIKPLGLNEFIQYPLQWATHEGWNPGKTDGEIFYHTEPKAHLGIEYKGKIIGSGSILSYKGEFGFMGLFIVDAAFRAGGIGRQLWYYRRDTLLNRLKTGAAIGMDGVFTMQGFYSKGGFEFSHRNLRMQGLSPVITEAKDSNCFTYNSSDFEEVINYDTHHFGFNRSDFLQLWLNNSSINSYIYKGKNKVEGIISYRPCVSGYKIGPLFADNESIAEKLLISVLSEIKGELFFLDIPENNSFAVSLAKKYNLKEVFGCARMYYGNPPDIAWENIYSITTFELG